MIKILTTIIIQSAICWAIFLAFYHICLRNVGHYHLARIYLLLSIIFGICIPLVPNFLTNAPEFVYGVHNQIDHIAVVVNDYVATPKETGYLSFFSWNGLFAFVYFAVVIALLLRIVLAVRSVFNIKPERISWKSNVKIIFHKRQLQPFAFLRRVFIPVNFPPEYLEIITDHEIAHVRQGHTFDILISRVLGALLWLNPLIYLYEFYLKEVHEYYADRVALRGYKVSTYQRALLESVYYSIGLPLTHAFNSQNVKKRINKMKQQNESSLKSRLLFLALLPMVIILSMAMNLRTENVDDALIPKVPMTSSNFKAVSSEPIVLDTLPRIGNTDVLKVTDQMPRFPGCEKINEDEAEIRSCAQSKLIQFLGNNIKYPELARKHGIEGTVIMQFTVSDKGIIKDAVVAKNIGYGCGEEALRVVMLMNEEAGNWTPGRHDGQNVNVQMLLPVKFKLSSESPKKSMSEVKAEGAEEEVFKVVEELPRFPGCEDITTPSDRKNCAQQKMLYYLYDQIKYPPQARKNGTEGTAVVGFIVKKDGSVSDIKLLRDPGDGCGVEAKRVVETMKNMLWIPGKQKGEAVNVQYNLPIRFKLGEPAKNQEKIHTKKYEGDEIFKIVEERPRFPGCEDQNLSSGDLDKCAMNHLLEFLSNNLNYPPEAKSKGVEGTVVISFIVDTDGSLDDIRVVRPVSGGCSEEAKRVVELMNHMADKWRPGHQRGVPVKVQYNLPIKFKMDDKMSGDKIDGEF